MAAPSEIPTSTPPLHRVVPDLTSACLDLPIRPLLGSHPPLVAPPHPEPGRIRHSPRCWAWGVCLSPLADALAHQRMERPAESATSQAGSTCLLFDWTMPPPQSSSYSWPPLGGTRTTSSPRAFSITPAHRDNGGDCWAYDESLLSCSFWVTHEPIQIFAKFLLGLVMIFG